MGFRSFGSGSVLRDSQVAPSNSQTSGHTQTGVTRDARPVPSSYDMDTDAPDFVDAAASQYRSAVVDAPGTTATEYLVWAANTAGLAGPSDPDPTWWTESGYGSIPGGSIIVGNNTDGSDRVIVTDNGSRDIGRIYAVVVSRGDVLDYDDDGWKNQDNVDPSSYGGQPRNGDNPYITLYFEQDEQDPRLGVARLTNAHLSALGGGLSVSRGDSVVIVHYTVQSSRFLWSKNDRYESRFGWNASSRRWEPFKGSKPSDIGVVGEEAFFSMSPAIKNLPVGSYLPGGSPDQDSYSMIRVGTDPGSSGSITVGGIEVRPDSEIGSPFTTNINGRVGQSNGQLEFSPGFISSYQGGRVWYVPNTFVQQNTGVVGKMTDGAIFLAPVPSIGQMPLVRFGSRRYLTSTVVVDDAALASTIVLSGEVVVSATTGLTKFNPDDLNKSNVNSQSFSKHYLGEDIIYDGVSLSGDEQPTRAPVRLVNQAGNPGTAASTELYIPDYLYLPTEFAAADTRRGLGRSGVIDAPDGTGATPDKVGTSASIRPGGDNTVDDTTGRIRQVDDGISDVIIFTQLGSIETTKVVDKYTDIPAPYLIPSGTVYISRERAAHGSRVVLSASDRAAHGSKPVFFLQPAFTPAAWTNKARLVSRNRTIFRFDGTEVLRFSIDGVQATWLSSVLTLANPLAEFFTTSEVVSSFGIPTIYESAGRIVIESANPDSGSVEIGFGVGGTLDLSGCTSLGFVPGWRAVGGVDNWLPDSGVSIGMHRSGYNASGSNGVPDFRSVDRIENQVLIDGVQASPFYFLNTVPLQDVAGIDDGVFFSLLTTISDGDTTTYVYRNLEHYQDVIHRFGQGKFDWVEGHVTDGQVVTPISTIDLGHRSVAPSSLEPAVGGGLSVSTNGGVSSTMTMDVDYIVQNDGTSGTIVLVDRYLATKVSGSSGVVTAGNGVFVDHSSDFVSTAVKVGDILVAGTDVYTISGVNSQTSVTVTPTPTSSSVVVWRILDSYPASVHNPSLVADQFYTEFDHLTQETMQIVVMTPLNATGIANMSAAIDNNRDMSIRFGSGAATSNNSATLTGLLRTEMGIPVNGMLVPVVTGQRFTLGKFVIKAGAFSSYQPVGVYSFSVDPVTVEYLLADSVDGPVGSIKFGSSFMSEWYNTSVYYSETFMNPALLMSGFAEYDPDTGEINLSAADVSLHANEVTYFAERMITKARRDVSINPILGSFSLNSPASDGSLVEVSYWQADVSGKRVGDKITELLPTFIRNEVSTRTRQNVYTFNVGATHVVDTTSEPVVYIGPVRQNYGRLDYIVDYPPDLGGTGRLTFVSHTVPDNVSVTVSYSVYDMAGGERSFEVSTKPVYRPPFYIGANQNRFGLRGDRTQEFEPGQLLRIGEECFYVKSSSYYQQNQAGTGDVTAVYIFPSTVSEVGSRSPGNDVITMITHGPVTTVVDPDGISPINTSAPAGFLLDFQVTFDPVTIGQTSFVAHGDATGAVATGSILEVAGIPYTVSDVVINDDGSRTNITITSGFRTSSDPSTSPTIKVSRRPVYPPYSTNFVGAGQVYTQEDYSVVLVDKLTPGRVLVKGVDVSVNTNTGDVETTFGVGPTQSLLVQYTRLNTLSPFVSNRVLSIPRYTASFLALQIPDYSNGVLGGKLVGTYTFSSPDSFYFRAVPLRNFVAEVVEEISSEISSVQPASGAIRYTQGPGKNWDQGNQDVYGDRRHLVDKDRVARAFLSYYNDVVVSFEQINETIQGGVVGDRDGKFRFWVGSNRVWPTPGCEDDVTGNLLPRNIWTSVVNNSNPASKFFCLTSDWIVSPSSLTVTSGVVGGDIPPAADLNNLILLQRGMVTNDVDDIVMTGIGSVSSSKSSAYPYFYMRTTGNFKSMFDNHEISRIFPASTGVMVRTVPGIGFDQSTGNPGVYSAGIQYNGSLVSTNGNAIARVTNPVIGDVTNISSVMLQKRRARSHVWGWYPDGIMAGSFGAGVPAVDITTPCVVATQVPLGLVLASPETGYPVSSQFVSQGGSVYDIESGDLDLTTPGFRSGDQLAWGKPDSTTYKMYNRFIPVSVFGNNEYTGIFVDEVLYGCVITVMGADGITITDPDSVYVGETRLTDLPPESGDTIYVVQPTGSFTSAPPDPPELSTLTTMTSGVEVYRDGFDVMVTSDGTITDISMPSRYDGTYLALKETFGQNAPTPMSTLGGVARFSFNDQNPLKIPALTGGYFDDSGDNRIPYVKSYNTEISRFSDVSTGLSSVYEVDDLGLSIYPDEVIGNDGDVVVTTGVNPSVMTTSEHVSPGFGPGSGNIRKYDLLINQVDLANPFSTPGAMGIHSVGSAVDGATSYIEVPRFFTATKPPVPGSAITEDIEHVVENAIVFVQGPYPAQPQLTTPNGVYIIEDVPGGFTVLDFGTTDVALNDGQTIAVGNLNHIVSSLGLITIKLIARQDSDIVNGPAGANPLPSSPPGGVVALTIDILGPFIQITDYQGTVYGPFGGLPVFGTRVPPLPVVVDNRWVRIPTTGMIPWGPGAGTPGQWFLPHTVAAGPVYTTLYGFEFSFTIDTRSGSPSDTAWISDDRLTFNEVFDLSKSKKRGYTHPQSGLSLETKLSVYAITVGQTVATTVSSSVNRYQNGMLDPIHPIPYTFVPRFDADTVGYWSPRVGATTERGTIKVMSFEGYNNTPVTAGNATFSAIPSNDRDAGGEILSGVGKTSSKFTILANYDQMRFDNRVTEVVPSTGDTDNVLPGDLLVILGSSNPNHPATHQAGTYLVRHAVRAQVPGDVYSESSPVTYAGLESGWCPLHFPTVVSFDDATNLMQMSDLAPSEAGPLYGGNPSGWEVPGLTTRVYVIRDVVGLSSSTADTFKYSVVSARYTSISGSAVFTLTDYKDALGVAIAASMFKALVSGGSYQVSGMTYWPVNVSGSSYGLPPDNCVGFDSESTLPVPALPWNNWAVYGFHALSIIPQGPLSTASTVTWTGDQQVAPGSYIKKAMGTPGCITPIQGVISDPHVFQIDHEDAVYPWVVRTLAVGDVSHSQWQSINVVPGSAGFVPGALVDCIIPGTKLALQDGVNDGHYAQTGVFLEPTFPRSAAPLLSASPRVVDASHSLPNQIPVDDWDRELGMRDAGVYSVATTPDEVSFSIRRIRRFHDVLDLSDQNLSPLRYVYETRRGVITGYSLDNKQRATVLAVGFTWSDGLVYTGTQLGGFDDRDVNVHAGDMLVVVDSNGNPVEEARIVSVNNSGSITIEAPGLTTAPTVGVTEFAVYLKTAPVPHEQSCDELLSLITDRTIHETVSDWGTQKGGYVPDITGVNTYSGVVNRLHDDLNANNPGDFTSIGVRKGDIIVIDPAGLIPKDGGLPLVDEYGRRPLGDSGVPDRTDPGVHVVGTPSQLDDNRGFYRVKKVVDTASPPYLVVDPINTFSGDELTPVFYANDPYSYCVYPTVSDSALKKAPYVVGNGMEAQMALRPTIKRDAVTKSFVTRSDAFVGHSIRPFSYRVIRPTTMFSDESIDLVLMARERTLSLIETLRQAMLGVKHGSYYAFQLDEHIKEVGNTSDPDVGLGVPSNDFIESISGRTDVVPFSNNSGCLSVLDRRVWIHDSRLDGVTSNPTGGMKTRGPLDTGYTDYSGSGSGVLPVLPELVSGALDYKDRFRDLRYTWLSYRTHKLLGTLAAIRGFDNNVQTNSLDKSKLSVATMAGEQT